MRRYPLITSARSARPPIAAARPLLVERWLSLMRADAQATLPPADELAWEGGPSIVELEGLPPTADDHLYSFLDFDLQGRPVSWPLDRPIRVAANLTAAAYSQFGADLLAALDKLRSASGFDLQAIGPSHLTAAEFRGQSPHPEVDILVSWVPDWTGLDGGNPDFAGTATSICGSVAGSRQILQSDVRLRGDISRCPGFVPGGWGSILLHELMHALGAGHCGDQQQIMCPTASLATDLGAGDRLALHWLREAARARAQQ